MENVRGRVTAVVFLFALLLAARTGPQVNGQTDGSWPFEPPERETEDEFEDEFEAEPLLDLRHLNEEVAGESGFVGLSEDGMSFVRGDGEPIRFWAVNSSGRGWSDEQMAEHARFLAKLGVNMARIGASLPSKSEHSSVTDVEQAEVDRIWRFVAALKKEGIYSTICPYWAHGYNLRQIPEEWGIEGYSGKGVALWGLLFFNERLQEGYRAWVKALYEPPNPYTGIPLKDEPAVAIIEIKNEDSLLFYTFQGIEEPQRGLLRRKFGDWLKERRGSLEKAVAAWDGAAHEKDDLAGGSVGLYQTWDFTSGAPRPDAAKARRMRDQLEFLAWVQRKFYSDMEDYYRSELGCRQLVNAMNWKSADPVLLDDAERWTYAANEVLAVNRYTGGVHVGENRGYRIDPGHYLVNESVLRNPDKLPVALKQVAGYPFIVTESAWVHPNLYQTEGPMLVAAYMSLTGVDSLCWCSVTSPTWLLDPRRMFWPVGDSYAVDKWSGSVPQQMGQFPAHALAFRRGYVEAAAEPVVYEERSLEDLWTRRAPIISESGKFDPNRDEGDYAPDSPVKQDVDRLAFLVGPVHVKYGGDASRSEVANLDRYIDRTDSTVRSVTGQIEFDYDVGLCTVNAPRYQGVTGFLERAGGRFALDDVTIESENEYATIVAVSLDGKDLAESDEVLIQVGTVARLTGWQSEEATFQSGDQELQGERIVNTGEPPWQIENTRATVTVRNGRLTRALLLDVDGYRARGVEVRLTGESIGIELPPETMYLLLQ